MLWDICSRKFIRKNDIIVGWVIIVFRLFFGVFGLCFFCFVGIRKVEMVILVKIGSNNYGNVWMGMYLRMVFIKFIVVMKLIEF